MRQFVIALGICSLYSGISKAQDQPTDVENVLTDLVFLTGGYVSPAADALVYQSTSSWASSATTLKKFEIDVSLHANALFIPDKQKAFAVSNSDFRNLYLQDGSQSAVIPSALGGDTNVFFDFTIDDDLYELQAYEGVNESRLIHPFIQASVGLWKETELTVRYSPKVRFDESNYEIYGAAVKHNISQYFRRDTTTARSIEVASVISYSRFDLNLFFDAFRLQSNSGGEPLAVINSIGAKAEAWLFQLISSYRTNRFEFMGAASLAVGDYQYNLGGNDTTFLNLLNRAMSVLEESRSTLKGDLGVNYHLGDFYISGVITLGKFPNTNIGFHYKI